MKLKKKVKRLILILLLAVIVGICGFYYYNNYFHKKTVKEVKVVNEVDNFGYQLKDNKTARYKEMFKELKDILTKDPIDEEKYVSKISEMFIYDFYSLNDKTAKTDVGGVDFVYSEIRENFLQNAENTYYKYLETNIYNNRKQTLPEVGDITINEVKQESFTYGEKTDDSAYKVDISWEYTDEKFQTYQKSATLVFIHDEKKLCLVELQ